MLKESSVEETSTSQPQEQSQKSLSRPSVVPGKGVVTTRCQLVLVGSSWVPEPNHQQQEPEMPPPHVKQMWKQWTSASVVFRHVQTMLQIVADCCSLCNNYLTDL